MDRSTAPPRPARAARLARVVPLVLAALFWCRPAPALETDQFTAPAGPLGDIGPEVAAKVFEDLRAVVERVNADADRAWRAASNTTSNFWRDRHMRRADEISGEAHLAKEVYDALAGPGLPECRVEQWVRRHDFRARPSSFRMTCGRGVYGSSPFTKPLLLVDLSPTVNVYGSYMGTDKIGHFFQQGYEYFEVYLREEAAGRDEPAKLARAVKLGIDQEKGFFGAATIGVYSNADLASNYAGLKFYLNLTRPVAAAGKVRPPVLARVNGRWEFNPPAGGADDVLRPFVTDHFNEALNPSHYSSQMRGTVRRRFRDRGEKWVAFYGSTRDAEVRRLARLATWYGEDYGHSGFSDLVTAVNVCFGD